MFFAGFFKLIAPGVEFSHDFSAQHRGFALSLCPGGGEFALSKNSPGGCQGGGDGKAWN